MDKTTLKNRIFEKTNTRIDENDPVFTLVALNEAVMETALAEGVDIIRKHVGEILTDQAMRLNTLREVSARVGSNIEAGIVDGTSRALVETNRAIDKLSEQAAQYQEKSAELENGLGQLVHNFQKATNEILNQEVERLANDMQAAGANFRKSLIDDQAKALNALVNAKKHQALDRRLLLGLAFGLSLLGGIVGSNFHAFNTNSRLDHIQELITNHGSKK